MDVWYASTQYVKYGNNPPYDQVTHAPIHEHAPPYAMRVPAIYLPWDSKHGVIALRRRERQLALCRCGVVLAGIYFRVDAATEQQIPVALKVMDRAQVLQQRDDVENEIRVMAQLQMAGVDAPLANDYMVRWEYASDVHNEYLATEFVANGSLQTYAHEQIRRLMMRQLEDFVAEHGEGPTKLECISYVYRGAGHDWMREGIDIFKGVVRGLTYLHAQGVAHLDLDVYNVAIDSRLMPRIIDLGSSQLMDNRGLVGAGGVGIKCKPLFVAPEVRSHQKIPPPRPGFNGAAADIWAAGVILVKCVLWGFRGGPTYLENTANWRRVVITHIDAACSPRSCHLCLNFVAIPPLIGAIIKQMLHVDPLQRPSAYKVAIALQENPQVVQFPATASDSHR